MEVIDATQTKRCSICLDRLPLEEFRTSGDWTDTRCRPCYREYMRDRYRRGRHREIDRMASKVHKESMPKRVVAVVDDVIQRLGGPSRVARLWALQIEFARAAKPGGRQVMSSLKALFRASVAVSQLAERRRPEEGLANLSDEELDLMMRAELDRFLATMEKTAPDSV